MNKQVNWFLFVFVILAVACKKDEREPEIVLPVVPLLPAPDSLELGMLRTVDVIGVVRDEFGQAIANASVRGGWSNRQTTTDARGFFLFEDLECYSRNAFVIVEKPGFFNGYRTWIPTDGGYNRLDIALLANTTVGTFSAADGGTIEAETFRLIFPPNAIRLGGDPFGGQVSVALNTIDAADELVLSRQIPGNLSGVHNGKLKVLSSMGMAAIEMRTETGELLEIDPNAQVEMRCNIPSELLTIAPSTIPLWSFDEAIGLWSYEGQATRYGDTYVANVNHFSYWNYDVEGEGINYTVTVNYNEFPIGVYPLDNALLTLDGANIPFIPGTTGSNGQVTGLVPVNEVMQLQIFLFCGNGYQEVFSTTVGPFNSDVSETYEVNALPFVATVTGTLQDCDGNAGSGYVWVNDESAIYIENGSLQFSVCTGINSLNAFCFSNGQTGTGMLAQVDFEPGVNEVTLVCEDCFPIGAQGSGVTDIDGNFYPTVINGEQEWMAVNLMVTRFSNGDAIPEVTDNGQWAGTTTPAWSYLDNNPGGDLIFGKLYNGFAMEDSRNICPTGWHLPSDAEWATLVNTLGGSAVAGSALRATGNISEGTGFWPLDNVITTNASGFSAQPAGFRNPDGSFAFQVYAAVYWTNTLTANDTYYTRSIYSSYNDVFNQDFSRGQGFSIRCLRD